MVLRSYVDIHILTLWINNIIQKSTSTNVTTKPKNELKTNFRKRKQDRSNKKEHLKAFISVYDNTKLENRLQKSEKKTKKMSNRKKKESSPHHNSQQETPDVLQQQHPQLSPWKPRLPAIAFIISDQTIVDGFDLALRCTVTHTPPPASNTHCCQQSWHYHTHIANTQLLLTLTSPWPSHFGITPKRLHWMGMLWKLRSQLWDVNPWGK